MLAHGHRICLLSKIGCQTWTRTKTSGLTNRRATLTPPGNGAAGRIPTCIVPFRRRMPHMFGHGSNLKLVSAAGFAPAVTRAQTEHVAATPRAVAPANGRRRGLGPCGDGCSASLDTSTHRRLAAPTGLEPALTPQTTGCFAIQLRSLLGTMSQYVFTPGIVPSLYKIVQATTDQSA